MNMVAMKNGVEFTADSIRAVQYKSAAYRRKRLLDLLATCVLRAAEAGEDMAIFELSNVGGEFRSDVEDYFRGRGFEVDLCDGGDALIVSWMEA